jgi:threonine/homoserine/homoserine lactone efflux protein
MPLPFFLKGAIIGLSIAAPVGPIGVLCIRRSLADGPRLGLAAGLGAATADGAYGSVAAFGLTFVSGFLIGQRFWLGLIGGIFLCVLGVRTFLAKPTTKDVVALSRTWLATYVSTAFLTLANPATILSFAAVFAGFGLAAGADYGQASVLVLGVFAGSALWWVFLCNGVGLFRSRLSFNWMQSINRLSGCVLLAFGLLALLGIFH